MSDIVDNERLKLTANWLNAMASAVIITGVIAPAIASIFGFSGAGVPVWLLATSTAIWLSSGIAQHFMGRRILRRLK